MRALSLLCIECLQSDSQSQWLLVHVDALFVVGKELALVAFELVH